MCVCVFVCVCGGGGGGGEGGVGKGMYCLVKDNADVESRIFPIYG